MSKYRLSKIRTLPTAKYTREKLREINREGGLGGSYAVEEGNTYRGYFLADPTLESFINFKDEDHDLYIRSSTIKDIIEIDSRNDFLIVTENSIYSVKAL